MTSSTRRKVVLVGERADLAARPFETEWGEVAIAAPGDADTADVVVILDPALAGTGSGSAARVVWHPAAHGAGHLVPRPWPVAEDLFEMPPSSRGNECLVLTGEGASPEKLVEDLTERGASVNVAPGATRELLASARIVVGLTPDLPAETFGILAAGRLLIARASERTFGLQPWIDHMPFSNEDDVAELINPLLACPEAWLPIQAFGRQTAEPHRATRAIARVARRMDMGG
jgi:hypothetical protein